MLQNTMFEQAYKATNRSKASCHLQLPLAIVAKKLKLRSKWSFLHQKVDKLSKSKHYCCVDDLF